MGLQEELFRTSTCSRISLFPFRYVERQGYEIITQTIFLPPFVQFFYNSFLVIQHYPPIVDDS